MIIRALTWFSESVSLSLTPLAHTDLEIPEEEVMCLEPNREAWAGSKVSWEPGGVELLRTSENKEGEGQGQMERGSGMQGAWGKASSQPGSYPGRSSRRSPPSLPTQRQHRRTQPSCGPGTSCITLSLGRQG